MATLLPTAAFAGKGGGTSTAVLEYSQCQNGGPPSSRLDCEKWGNGILNSSNSHYAEDQVTPQRLLLSTSSGSTNTVTIRYMTRKGSANAHAYDSLATWNVTQTQADRCQGISGCPGGAADLLPMESDPNPVTPTANGVSSVTAAHELPAASRQWVMYGGDLLSSTVPVHTTDPTDTSSDYAKVTVTFKATSSKVLLLFGGHLAASSGPRGWGAGLGSSSISGGPYHIILDAINGASAGSRDNQIMSSAILPGSPDYAVTKTASTTSAVPGQVVTYTVTVKNNGTVSGSTAFTDDFDDRLSPSTATSTPAGNDCSPTTVNGNKLFSCTTGVLAANGGTQTFVYTAAMPATFTDGAGTGGCAPGTFPVINTVQLTSGAQDTVRVCVAASPDLKVTKTASPSTTTPGSTVTYTITVENKGKAAGSTTWDDDFDDRLSPSVASTSGGPNCTSTTVSGNKLFDDCATGTINAGATKVWTYTAVMPSTFTGTPGTGCDPAQPKQYPVRNVVVLASGDTDDAIVCVNTQAKFSVLKQASKSIASPGETITYTITVTNIGSATGSTTWDDDFDDRLSPSTATSNPAGNNCAPTTVSGNKKFDDCATAQIDPDKSQVFTYTAVMPSTFTGTPGTGCGTGSPVRYPARNVVVLADGTSDDETVCVSTEPVFTVIKSANKGTANPGEVVTYTITVRNTGSGPGSTTWTDDFDDRLSPSTATSSPSGNNCTATTVSGNKKFNNCATGTIQSGGEQTFTYTAAMPATFSSGAGTGGCKSSPPRYPVFNRVTLATGATDDETVCVNASPTFTVNKSASKTHAAAGEVITYTITVTNGGTAAGSTTWSDDFDDRLSPSTATSSPSGNNCTATTVSGNKKFNSCATGTIQPGSSQTFTYTAAMPASFTGAPGGNGCNGTAGPGQEFPVRNVVVLTDGANDDAIVCVNAEPLFVVNKTASKAVAQPGENVTWTITVTNNGKASGSTTWTDDFDDRLSPSTATSNPAGNNCTATTVSGNKKFNNCATGTINPGSSQTFTYTADLPDRFAGTAGGSGCNGPGNNQQYPVVNVVVLGNGANDDAVVCVPANPDLQLVKTVAKSTDAQGHQVLTYTLTYTNTGAAAAPTATITEEVPTGTQFAGCSNGCQVSAEGVATWTVGPIAPKGGTGSVTFTVTVTSKSLCSITNTAKISAIGFNGGDPASSNTLNTEVTPTPDPDNAHASGYAFGAKVTTGGLLNLSTSTLSDAQSAQSGIGQSNDSETLLSASVPAILDAQALRTTSTSRVTAAPAMSSDTSTSEVLGLCLVRLLLVCTVESSTVRSVAHAEASGTTASFSAAGSVIEDLKVVGSTVPVDLSQTTTIPLAALVFGSGSYVKINERTGGTDLSGGVNSADLEVNLIHLHITGALGVQAVDITVAHAEAHADFPELTLCGPQVDRSVSGHALIASAAVLPPLVLATQGYVGIPASGGSEEQQIAGVSAINGQLLATGVAKTSSIGTIDATSATSTGRAEAANVCVLRFPSDPTKCVVMADAVKSVSTSTANGSASSDDRVSATDRTELVNLRIRTSPGGTLLTVPIDPPPNFTISLPGIGFLVLNEQVCDGGSLAATGHPRCTGSSHSGLTVRSLHLVLLQNFGQFSPGVEVIVAEAHSDATSG
jgi:uncharacterized repeat protein (TIGR01451 family)/fimbrial isopeptide formation D2 family protein